VYTESWISARPNSGFFGAQSPPEAGRAAREARTADFRTAFGIFHGTARYVSPERACGLELDEHSDVYALGILVQQLVVESLDGRLGGALAGAAEAAGVAGCMGLVDRVELQLQAKEQMAGQWGPDDEATLERYRQDAGSG
jgi:hypothetical protein